MIVEKNEGSVNGANGHAPDGLKVADLMKLRPQKIEWLWEGRIPRGCISLLEGDPGLGKTMLTISLASAVSTGSAFFPDVQPLGLPADVVFLSAEDAIETTILPRLKAAGADLSRVHPVSGFGEGADERPVVLPDDLPLIEELVKAKNAALVVIDPLMAFLSGKYDAHKDADIRRVLYSVKLMAENTGAAVLILRHLNKASNLQALYRGGGSIGIIGAARAGFVVARHPEQNDVRVIAPQKANLGREVDALLFRLVEKEVDVYGKDGTKEVTGIGCVEWIGEVDLTADEILAKAGAEESGKRETAKDYLQKALAGGPVLASNLLAGAKELGIAERTLKRAKEDLKVKAYQEHKQWYAKLPEGGVNPVQMAKGS